MLNSSSPPGQEETRSTPVPPDLRAHGLWIFESRHDQSFAMPVTQHPFFKLLLIREGSGDIEFEGLRACCESGSLVLVPAGVRHRIIDKPRAPIALYGLGIEIHCLPSLVSVLANFSPRVHDEAELRTLRLEPRLRKLLFLNEHTDAANQLASIATAIDLLAELSLLLNPPGDLGSEALSGQPDTTGSPGDPLMEAYLAWLHRNFFQSLSLADAAVSTGMSRRTFTNRFKARTGATWLTYVNRLRVEHAEHLLTQTDSKITSIAFQSGFEDLTTFYRAFKRIHGKNPGELRD